MSERARRWWADDWHIVPRKWRDLVGWVLGGPNVRVGLWSMAWDEEAQAGRLDYVRIPKGELPGHALHVSGKGWKEWMADEDGAGRFPEPGEITAVDLYLYAKSDDIDLALNKKKPLGVEAKTLMYAGLAVAGLVAAWMVMRLVL